MATSSDSVHPSAAVYTNFVLHFYDFVVLKFSNTFTWCCSTQDVLIPLFRKHIGQQAHLDVGVGSGYYLAQAVRQFAEVERVTLVDLNSDALDFSEKRMKAAGHKGTIEKLVHDVFQPIPGSMVGVYDSVSLFYVFHCLPGKLPTKAQAVFTQIKCALKPDGVVYGATILGQEHNWGGNRLMAIYNKKGVFSNYEDTKEGLEEALKEHFAEVDKIQLVGRVALFVARKPIV